MSMGNWDYTVCASEPPRELTDDKGQTWLFGDCWCTLPPNHPEPLCICGPCTERHGAPGWPTPESQPDGP